jgi:hypothetical protein
MRLRTAWSLVVGIPVACAASFAVYWFRERR